jgi:thymidylate synthase
MNVFEIDDNQNGYVGLLRYVHARGQKVDSRVGPARELMNTAIVLHDPRLSMVQGVGRQRINNAVGVAEGMFLVAGYTDDEMLCRITPAMKNYADDDGYFHGAYGRRASCGLIEAIDLLRRSPDTRQAVVNIWDSILDQPLTDPHRDMPCTLSLSFHIRDGKLRMTTVMRSNDAWLGWTYDSLMFTMLQLTVADYLGIPPGPYTHIAHSFHLYERDVRKADQLHIADPDFIPAPTPWFSAGGYPSWLDVQTEAGLLIRGSYVASTQNDRIIDDVLSSYRDSETNAERFSDD